jgi:dienelactone hydrolase/pimeloyl-ACP methyl ester carboxylesterase
MHSPKNLLSRRSWLKQSASVAASGALLSNSKIVSTVLGQGNLNQLDSLNRFPRMVQEFYVRRVREETQKSDEIRAALQSRSDAELYVKTIRQHIRNCFGPEPDRTPLNPRITGVLDRDGYRVEKLIFESRPGFLVTANLYVPTDVDHPMPGVIGTCGHSRNGKAEAAYQSFSQGLARMGYVVLIYDPIGQGERLQYVNDDLKSTVGVGVREHLYAGNQQFLVNEFIGTWRAWDGIRALDYLLTREEVDPKHIGVTGNSGGGTMTTWLCGLESRWTMAAPSCFVTTFRRNLENELPADTEQCPPKSIALGVDHVDYLIAMAPKPVVILAKEKDYFDVRGARKAFEQLRHVYRLLGAEDQVKLFVGPTYHGYSIENREAMYDWFNRATGIQKPSSESEIKPEKDEDLQCTPKGQVAEMGSKTVFQFTAEKAGLLSQKRAELSANRIRQAFSRHLGLPAALNDLHYRILRPRSGRGYPLPHATSYVIETEPDAQCIVYRLDQERHYSRPKSAIADALLYISHHSADRELRQDEWVRKHVPSDKKKVAFYACDVRGVGESRPDTCGENSFLQPYGNDYFYAIHGIMLNRPYVGQKTLDVLQVLRWLEEAGHKRIQLVAQGWGSLPAAFAAMYSNAVYSVKLKGVLNSFHSIATSEEYQWPLSSFVPSILEEVDLPDCYTLLKAEKDFEMS